MKKKSESSDILVESIVQSLEGSEDIASIDSMLREMVVLGILLEEERERILERLLDRV